MKSESIWTGKFSWAFLEEAPKPVPSLPLVEQPTLLVQGGSPQGRDPLYSMDRLYPLHSMADLYSMDDLSMGGPSKILNFEMGFETPQTRVSWAGAGPGTLKCRQWLEDLKSLQDGWYEGKGLAPSQTSRQVARQIVDEEPDLTQYFLIYPLIKGGVLFEFVIGNWDYSIEVNQKGVLMLFGVEVEGRGEFGPFESLPYKDLFHQLHTHLWEAQPSDFVEQPSRMFVSSDTFEFFQGGHAYQPKFRVVGGAQL